MRKTVCLSLLITLLSMSMPLPAGADMLLPQMPSVGTMVHLSPAFTPAHLSGMTIHPDDALKFDFLIHRGDASLADDTKKQEYAKLVKYFLASLTIPDEDQWVNLSPYEKDRIIKDDFGKTEMGRDLLAQDYMLKQITASLIYPEDGLGKKFWDKIYERAWKEYGSTEIPVNTFNKVWIVPDEAVVYESGNTAYVLRNHLKVMLESDYLAIAKNKADANNAVFPTGPVPAAPSQSSELGKLALPVERAPASGPPVDIHDAARISAQIIKEIILPELEKEVNEGKNFANLRQVYSGMILATWYKNALKESLLSKVYANQGKVKGINQDPRANEVIYQQYLKAFKKGVFNYIKEDVDKYTKQEIPRKYFSGGTNPFTGLERDPVSIRPGKVAAFSGYLPANIITHIDPAIIVDASSHTDKVSIALNENKDVISNAAMTSEGFKETGIHNLPGPAMSQAPSRTVTAGQQWQWGGWDDAVGQLRGELYLAKKGEDFDILVSYVDDEDQSHQVTIHEISLLDAKGAVALSNHNRAAIEPRAGEVVSIEGKDSEGRVIRIEKLQFRRLVLSYKSPITADMMMHIRGPGQISLSEIVSRLKTLRITKVQAAQIFQEFDHHYVNSIEKKPIDQYILERFSHYLAKELQYDDAKIPFIMDAIKVIFYYSQGELRSARDSQRYREAVIASLDEAMAIRMSPMRAIEKGEEIPFVFTPGLRRDFELDLHYNQSQMNVSIAFSITLTSEGKYEMLRNGLTYVFHGQPMPMMTGLNGQVRDGQFVISRGHDIDGIYVLQEKHAFNLFPQPGKIFSIKNAQLPGDGDLRVWKDVSDNLIFQINKTRTRINIKKNPFNSYFNPNTGLNIVIQRTSEGFNIINRSNKQDLEIEEQFHPSLPLSASKLLRFVSAQKGNRHAFEKYLRLLGKLANHSGLVSSRALTEEDIDAIQAKIIDSTTVDISLLRWYALQANVEEDYLAYIENLENVAQRELIVSQAMLSRSQATEVAKENSNDSTNPAMFTPTRGGIDFNPTNFNLLIKRDGNGVPLPLSQQDMAQLMQVEGFIPVILAITPALNVPILTELQHQLQPALR